MDVVLAALGLVLALPVMAVAALALALEDPGPFLHAQLREGRGGRTFRMWKLRTMYRDAEQRIVAHLQANAQARREWEQEFKLTDDPRVIPGVGTFLRRWSLDECPQLWNVLRGDMSLVGPRALPAYHLEAFGPEFRVQRRRVRPGLTGLWQVTSRGRGAIRTQEALDLRYISHWSVWTDVVILARTVRAVISGRGAR
jgi:lipopolysaccharide/colanic/teichoic acid biosynthesis glycosyltransferase